MCAQSKNTVYELTYGFNKCSFISQKLEIYTERKLDFESPTQERGRVLSSSLGNASAQFLPVDFNIK
jgi:hypothetical protein